MQAQEEHKTRREALNESRVWWRLRSVSPEICIWVEHVWRAVILGALI